MSGPHLLHRRDPKISIQHMANLCQHKSLSLGLGYYKAASLLHTRTSSADRLRGVLIGTQHRPQDINNRIQHMANFLQLEQKKNIILRQKQHEIIVGFRQYQAVPLMSIMSCGLEEKRHHQMKTDPHDALSPRPGPGPFIGRVEIELPTPGQDSRLKLRALSEQKDAAHKQLPTGKTT
jgi:hypothetical protein